MITALAVIAVIVILIFAFSVMWDPPKKHKEFSLRDRDEATSRALGGIAPPDASQVELHMTETEKHK